MINYLIKKLEKTLPLTPVCKRYLRKTLIERRIPKQSYVLKAGTVCQNLGFLVNGLVRGYTSAQGRVITTRFIDNGGLCIVPTSFYTQRPSEESLKTICDSVIFEMPFSEIQLACNRYPDFGSLLVKMMIYDFLEAEGYLWMMRTMRPDERYKRFLQKVPGFDRHFPNYMSSFIGISKTQLDRLRKAHG